MSDALNDDSNVLPEAAPAALDFANVLDHCLEGALVAIDAQQNVVAFAGDAEKYTGLSASDALSKPVDVLPSPLRELLQKTFSTGRPHRDVQMLLGSGKDRGLDARVTTAVLRGPGGRPGGVIALIYDLAPIRNLEHRLRRLDRLASLGTLSAGVAHEVKNALVAVKTFVDLLRNQHQDAPLADLVNREIGRIDSIVSQLLRFSGRTRSAFESLRLHEVLDRSLALVQHQLDANKIQVRRSFEAASDLVQGDAYQLEQAFMNLLLNALEALSAGGELVLSTKLVQPDDAFQPAQPLLSVTIQDNGAGIPPEHVSHLFEPFFTTKAHGTGLGLSITQRIIQEHQGSVDVESQPGQGTKFILTFPSAARQP